MIEGERRGPFPLESLYEEGVTPDTFVWCKGMDDWEKAEDVADICRYWRQRLFSMMHPVALTAPATAEGVSPQTAPVAQEPEVSREAYMRGFRPVEDPVNETEPPVSLLTISILLTLLCFPVTGVIAVFYSIKSRKAWDSAARSESKNGQNLYSDEERTQLRKDAHDFARSAKMWVGITFFLGMILYSFLLNAYV